MQAQQYPPQEQIAFMVHSPQGEGEYGRCLRTVCWVLLTIFIIAMIVLLVKSVGHSEHHHAPHLHNLKHMSNVGPHLFTSQ